MQAQFYPESEEEFYMAFGELSRRAIDGSVSPVFVDYVNQRVLIGATTASGGTNRFEVDKTLAITSGGNANFVNNLGVGTISPVQRLDVRGAAAFSGLASAQTLANATFIGGGTGGLLTAPGGFLIFQGPDATTNGAFTLISSRSDSTNGIARMFIDAAGAVGIPGTINTTGNINSTGSLNCLNVTAGGLNITSTANFRSALNVTGGVIVSGGTMTVYSGSTIVLTMGAWTAWTPTFTGFSANPTVIARYALIGKTCIASVITTVQGTSNATTLTISAPITSADPGGISWKVAGLGVDNGSSVANAIRADIPNNSSTITVYKDWTGAAWTASGGKSADFTMIYEVA